MITVGKGTLANTVFIIRWMVTPGNVQQDGLIPTMIYMVAL